MWRANGGADRREVFRGDGPIRRNVNNAGPDTERRMWRVQYARDWKTAKMISQGYSPTGP